PCWSGPIQSSPNTTRPKFAPRSWLPYQILVASLRRYNHKHSSNPIQLPVI
uniref:Uncharacterized protein n=1 Tax=Oryza brachyantha TaxID=4533 RepID=J3MG55_ORYBR